ncbi:MAG: gluconate 5-dehydrogenase [Spirochaetae bacterium HGW-Spirochaetae-8]|jgi:NAD(P)-dependent dehydrogenase (short-subunit alcohol dehydrogenase family)|nr:MAG: gluconate 5-dehydrogenase [Spirochaetae bacterium HGW-Spirochaetae-8]
MFDFTNKTVCIIGGAGYLGTAMSKGFLTQGADLVVADLNPQRLQDLQATLKQQFPHKEVMIVTVDAGVPAQIDGLYQRIAERYGKLDVLVNATFANAGKSFDDLTEEDFDRTNKVNISGSFGMVKRALPFMPEGSAIVQFSSMYGIVSPNPSDYPNGLQPNPIEYGVGKAAIIQMTRYLAMVCGKRNIRVNAVAPGAFPYTTLHAGNDEFIKRLSAKSMLNRIGKAPEIVGAVVFLASDEASFVTGEVLSVDGGVTAW